MKDFFAVGHITNDLLPTPHVGGGVSYSAVVARRLGMDAHIITELPPNHPYLKELEELGIHMHRLPAVNPQLEETITTFRNFYDEKGNRRQIVSERQDDITVKDLPYFPDIPRGSVILVAPVVGEVDVRLFPELSKRGSIAVTPQGYFRSIESNGIVKQKPWQDVDALQVAELVILSDEDVTFNGEMDEAYFARIRELCRITVLTQGENGLTVFRENEEPIHIAPFKLKKNEARDLTGAGDSAAAAFVWHYFKWKNIKEAGAFAALYPALKIMGIGGEGGIHALPTLEQIQRYSLQNRERVASFYKSNELEMPSFLEGNRNFLERR